MALFRDTSRLNGRTRAIIAYKPDLSEAKIYPLMDLALKELGLHPSTLFQAIQKRSLIRGFLWRYWDNDTIRVEERHRYCQRCGNNHNGDLFLICTNCLLNLK